MARWLKYASAAALALSFASYAARNLVEPWSAGGRDFGVDYCAARLVFRGAALYDEDAWRRERSAVGDVMDRGGYIKPPLFAVLLAPLATLSFDASRRVWLVANHLVLAAVVVMLGRTLFGPGAGRRAGTLALGLVALNSQPVSSHLLAGQTNLLILLLVCIALWAFRRGLPWVAGAAVGVAAAAKLYPVALVAYFLWKRQWRAVVAALAAAAACTGLTLWAVGLDAHVDYVARVLPTLMYQRPDVAHYSNQSIYAFSHRLFVDSLYTDAVINSPVRARLVALVCAAVLVGITVVLCRPSSGHVDIEVSLVVIATTVLVTQAWDMNFVAMLLPTAVAIRHVAHMDRAPGARATLVLIVALVLINARFGVWEGSAGRVRTAMLLCPRLVGSLLLYLWLARALPRCPSPGTATGADSQGLLP